MRLLVIVILIQHVNIKVEVLKVISKEEIIQRKCLIILIIILVQTLHFSLIRSLFWKRLLQLKYYLLKTSLLVCSFAGSCDLLSET